MNLSDFSRKLIDRESKILIKNSAWLFPAKIISVGSTFLESIILARFLGPATFGVYILMLTFVDTIQEFINFNTDSAVVKYASEFKVKEEYFHLVAFLKMMFFITFISILLSMIIIGIYLNLTNGHLLIKSDLGLSFIIIFALARGLLLLDNINMALLRVFENFRLVSIIQIILSCGQLLIVGLSAYLSRGKFTTILVAVITSNILSAFIKQISVVYVFWGSLQNYRSASIELLKGRRKEIFKFIISNSLSRTVKIIHTRADVLILGSFASTAAVGLYSVAKKLVSLIPLVTDPISLAIYPQISALVSKGDLSSLRTLLRNITTLLSIPVVIFVLFIITFGDSVIGI